MEAIMEIVNEKKIYTVTLTEKEYEFVKWALDNSDDIELKSTPLTMGETNAKYKTSTKQEEGYELPF